jgi:hypothetical protein
MNDSLTSLQEHVNGIVIPPDNINQISTLNTKVMTLGERITTMDDKNSAAHIQIINEMNNFQNQIDGIKVPDFSSDILII